MVGEMLANDETMWPIKVGSVVNVCMESICIAQVEYVDNSLAKVYMNSATAQRDFSDMPFMLRQAISLARRLQDPLIEFCQAFNDDDDLLCLSLHAAQDMVCVCARTRAHMRCTDTARRVGVLARASVYRSRQ